MPDFIVKTEFLEEKIVGGNFVLEIVLLPIFLVDSALFYISDFLG